METDDIVQETYAVLAALPRVEHIASPRAYAFQTANSVILRHLRRARIVRIEAIDNIEGLPAEMDEPSPERQTAARQQLRQVGALIADLPARCREAFVLRKVEGLSQREIARRMKVSESTVEKHIGRALRALMAAMKTSGATESQASGMPGDQDLGEYDKPRVQRRH